MLCGLCLCESSAPSQNLGHLSLVELTEKAGAKVLDTVKIKYPGFFGGVSEETKKVVTETVAKYYAELNN